MIETTHYIQLVKRGRSSCGSVLVLREFSGEIYGMVKQEISEWESRWKTIIYINKTKNS